VSRILAVANSKGGVAKTTTVLTLGAAMVELGQRTLLVDLDAQGCLTYGCGADADSRPHDLAASLLDGVPPAEVRVSTAAGPDLLPAGGRLAAAELALMPLPGRDRALACCLRGIEAEYDIVIMDCSPSLGLLTLNALTAADEVLVPVQCEMLAHRAVGQLLDAVEDVRSLLNPSLRVLGVLPTMADLRGLHARAVLQDLHRRYDVAVLEPAIPRSVRFAEAPALGLSVLQTATGCAGARAYRRLARRILDGRSRDGTGPQEAIRPLP